MINLKYDALAAVSCSAAFLIEYLGTGSICLDAVLFGLAGAGLFKSMKESRWNL